MSSSSTYFMEVKKGENYGIHSSSSGLAAKVCTAQAGVGRAADHRRRCPGQPGDTERRRRLLRRSRWFHLLAGTLCHWQYHRLFVAGAPGLCAGWSLCAPPRVVLLHSGPGRPAGVVSLSHPAAERCVSSSRDESAHLLDDDRDALCLSAAHREPTDDARRRALTRRLRPLAVGQT